MKRREKEKGGESQSAKQIRGEKKEGEWSRKRLREDSEPQLHSMSPSSTIEAKSGLNTNRMVDAEIYPERAISIGSFILSFEQFSWIFVCHTLEFSPPKYILLSPLLLSEL